ncbi:ABC transporter ATP-binding protein [Candidatus Micrarchaeota archaeon]|nr:ABC transporter ATP-binding protein [Candidatus Micrarchaeota archaeon]
MVELRQATKTYRTGETETTVLHGITFSVKKGEFVAIVGPSGSGKSTLLNLLGCLDTPTTGQVIIDGTDAATRSSDKLADLRARKIGFVFQAYNILANLTALQNVELAMQITEMPREERNARAKELLEKVGLGHRMEHKPAQMSGGEKQRVAIARALANEPPLLLMDEPTGNLDTASSLEVMDLAEDLWKKQGVTILLITHEKEIADYAQRTIFVRDGRIEKIVEKKNRGAQS